MSNLLSLLFGGIIGLLISGYYYKKQKKETKEEDLLKYKQRIIDKIDLYFVCFEQDDELKKALTSLVYTIQHERYFGPELSIDMQDIIFNLELSNKDRNHSKIALITKIERIYRKHHPTK